LLNVVSLPDLERHGAIGPDDNGPLRPIKKTAGNSEKQRAASLLFRPSIARKPSISAENEGPLADNFVSKQQKQREVHRMHAMRSMFVIAGLSRNRLASGPRRRDGSGA
jgi:hypothetical protein